MSKEIDVACPGCKSIFRVPIEYCGEIADCEECGESFKIQDPNKKPDTKDVEIDLSKVTHTVKLARSGIGMIPEVKDGFQLGAPHPAATATKPKPAKRKKKKTSKPQIHIPKWTNIDIKNADTIVGLKECNTPLWKIPLMACLPVLLSGILGIILTSYASIAIAVVLVIAIAIAVFATAPKGKKALVVTKDRSICMIDKIRLEIKH
jgi:hypothetical protein